jgi:hypothetical protein
VSEVSIVFHSAATVKFDEELTKSVAMNVGAVLSIVNLCKKMPNLEVRYSKLSRAAARWLSHLPSEPVFVNLLSSPGIDPWRDSTTTLFIVPYQDT